jgi:hypothetical protein
VVNNLRSESRLGDAAWRDIVEALRQSPRRAGNLKRAYVKACQKHILEGEALPTPWPVCYGRAVSPQRFYKWLKEGGYVSSIPEARSYVQRLFLYPLVAVRVKLQKIDLGPFVMWATFDPNNPAGDPFSAFPSDADGIRAQLGINLRERGQPLLLFVYELPSDVEPRFPTVADAQWHVLFRPAPPSARWGLVMPWPEVAEKEPPRPEVVHKPITGATLAEPIRLVEVGITP